VTALFLLEYCLQGVASKDFAKELAGLPLLPLADGSLGVLRAKKVVDLKALGQLQGMGFSEAASRRALGTCGGDADKAVNWLFEHGDGDSSSGGGSGGPPGTQASYGVFGDDVGSSSSGSSKKRGVVGEILSTRVAATRLHSFKGRATAWWTPANFR
jgi:hypothetical protein